MFHTGYEKLLQPSVYLWSFPQEESSHLKIPIKSCVRNLIQLCSVEKHKQAHLWACGRGDVSIPSFGSHLNPISTRGADYAHPTYWCPHQVLKATGAPAN